MERALVRVERIEENVPPDATHIKALPRASSRGFKILHANSVTNGEGGTADMLHGDIRPP